MPTLDPLWVAGAIFFATYAVVMSEKFNRAVVALLGAGLTIFLGVQSQETAIGAIDWNTIGLLTGMMIIVAVTRRSGVFQYLAIWSAKKVKARPWGLLVMLSLVTAVLSAFLDNVTTVLLIVPVTLLITEELNVPAYPFLFAEILFANIGGTATLIGDPPNILIGSQVNSISFNDFLTEVAPVVPVIILATMLPIWLIWGRKLHATAEARERVMAFDEKRAIKDVVLLRKSLTILFLVMLGFAFAHPLGVEPAAVAMSGAALLLLLDNLGRDADGKTENVHHTAGEVEWVTIFFFVGLFIIVGGLEQAGALDHLAGVVTKTVDGIQDGDIVSARLSMMVMWVSAIASSVIDNIPFVATMIPTLHATIDRLAQDGVVLTHTQEHAIWWSLSLGACLGGNGTLIGASANLIVAGFAERQGHRIRFATFLLHAFPMMLMTVAIASLYVWLRYLR